MRFEKFINDKNEVAVLYSPGYGAGWSTCNNYNGIVFDKRIVTKVLEDRKEEITEEFMSNIGYADVYCGGAEDLEILWVPRGISFRIDEYDGSESVELIGEFLTA